MQVEDIQFRPGRALGDRLGQGRAVAGLPRAAQEDDDLAAVPAAAFAAFALAMTGSPSHV